MDEVVALSNSFRHRHVAPTSKTLDGIPPLTHTLTQLHHDSTRLLPSNPPQVHSAALRLFSSLQFDTHRLHNAVTSLDSSLFLDRSFPPFSPLRHPLWLAHQSAENARLSNTSAVRNYLQRTLLSDIHRSNARMKANISRINTAFDSRAPHHHPNLRTPRSTRPLPTSSTKSIYPHVSALVPPYFDPIRAIALHGDSPSTATLMHETASSAPEPPHFVEALAILASVARHVPPDHSPSPHFTVWGARVVLEDLFAEHIGGLPTKPRLATPAAILPRIYEYVRTIVPRGTDTVWPAVYFCFRIGHVEAALQVLRDANEQRRGGFETIIHVVKAFIEGRGRILRRHAAQRAASGSTDHVTASPNADSYAPMIPGCLEAVALYQELETEYKQKAWDSNNPYMRLSYVLLMRLEQQTAFNTPSESAQTSHDTSRHPLSSKHEKYSLSLPESDISQLLGSVEDYLWFRLWLCRPEFELGLVAAPVNSTIVRLEAIQSEIKAFGSEYFDPEGSQPLLFAFVLVTVGLYETALSHLAQHVEEVWSHYAVHLGIVLYQLRWLANDRPFHEILRDYVFLFSVLHPLQAALYFMTLRDREVVGHFLSDLILSTKEYDQLLGRADSPDSPGALESLLKSASVPPQSGFNDRHLRDLKVNVATAGAIEASKIGDFTTAAMLFDLAENKTKRVDMVIRNLSAEVHKLSSQKRSLAVSEARHVLSDLCNSSGEADDSAKISLSVLMKMSQIFEEYWTGRYASAWDAVRDVRVLPLSSDRISSCQREFVSQKGMFHESVRNAVEELLKVSLHIAEYALETGNVLDSKETTLKMRTEPPKDPRHPHPSEIKALCIFASMVGLNEAGAYQRLAHIEHMLA